MYEHKLTRVYIALFQKRKKGTVVQARKRAKSLSYQPVLNPLWELPMGSNLQGIYAATPPELLHQYGLGIEKRAFEFTWELMKQIDQANHRGPAKNKEELDRRISAFNTRHADAEMPRYKFGAGVHKLAYVSASEYRALMYQVGVPVICSFTSRYIYV